MDLQEKNWFSFDVWATLSLLLSFVMIFLYASFKAFTEITSTYKYCKGWGPADYLGFVPQNITAVIMPFIDAKITFRLIRMGLFFSRTVVMFLWGALTRMDVGEFDTLKDNLQKSWENYYAECTQGFTDATEALRASTRADLAMVDDFVDGQSGLA